MHNDLIIFLVFFFEKKSIALFMYFIFASKKNTKLSKHHQVSVKITKFVYNFYGEFIHGKIFVLVLVVSERPAEIAANEPARYLY